MPNLIVIGTENLGRSVLDHYVAAGWGVAAIARDKTRLAGAAKAGAHTFMADAADPAQLRAAFAGASEKLGEIDLLVNAASAAYRQPGEAWGGGPLADATLEQFRRWSHSVSELTFVFLSEAGKLLRKAGRGGTLIQVTNESARRAQVGNGSWAAGHHALAALTSSAAQELNPDGIRVCVLIVEGKIDNAKAAGLIADGKIAREATVDPPEIVAAIDFLASRPARGVVRELAVAAAAARPDPVPISARFCADGLPPRLR